MGALTRVKIDYVNLKEWITALPSQVHIYGTLLDGENIYTTQLDKEGIIIIGNESQGISAEIQALVNTRIKIPAYGNSRMESLNAAIATAIVCAEFRR
jgi:TrmH family RNA methyltransferase